MEIKSIPTDNMYKFFSIFCIALLLASTYAVVSVNNSFTGRIFEIVNNAVTLESKSEELKKEGKSLSVYETEILGYYWRNHKIEVSNRRFIISALGLTIGLSIVGAIVGFYLWYKKLQIHLDKQAMLEVLKLEKEIDKI